MPWRLLKKLCEELKNLAQKYPEKRVELWCQDESRIGQKGRRTHGWAIKGSRPPVPIDTRYQNAYIFGAFCPERDTAVGLVLPWVNTEMMQMHLDEIAAALPENTHAALIVDGAGWHRSDALIVPEDITLIRTPASSPECNTAEKPWQFLKDNFLSHQVFTGYQDILDACHHAWNVMTAEPGRIQSLTNMHHLICQVN